jgi:hypothetical protein
MEDSVLSFLKAEWKVSYTVSINIVHLNPTMYYQYTVYNKLRFQFGKIFKNL